MGQLGESFGKPYAGARAEGHQFGYHTLRDVRRRQEGDGAIVRGERQDRGGHVDVDNQGRVRDQTHLGLTGGAGGHVENRQSLVVEARADALEGVGIGG